MLRDSSLLRGRGRSAEQVKEMVAGPRPQSDVTSKVSSASPWKERTRKTIRTIRGTLPRCCILHFRRIRGNRKMLLLGAVAQSAWRLREYKNRCTPVFRTHGRPALPAWRCSFPSLVGFHVVDPGRATPYIFIPIDWISPSICGIFSCRRGACCVPKFPMSERLILSRFLERATRD